MQQLKTVDVSPKAVLAFLYPFIATLAASAGSWIVSGDFNTAEIRVALSGLIASGLALLGAYVGRPGNVQPVSGPDAPR